MLYPSGVAAIAGALLTVLRPGDVLLMTDNAYDPSRAMGKGLLRDFGVETRFFDPLDVAGFEAMICEKSRAVLLEAPGSLTMEVQDVPALAKIARNHGLVSLSDNTWASPLGFPALERGVDISIMSLTKHVGGHSDLMMGSVSAGEELYARLRKRAQSLGQVVSPDDAALALRGLRTADPAALRVVLEGPFGDDGREAVADARHGIDHIGGITELGADPRDDDGEPPPGMRDGLAPEGFRERVVCHDAPGLGDDRPEGVELHEGQPHRLTLHRHEVPLPIDDQVSSSDHRYFYSPGAPSRDASEQRGSGEAPGLGREASPRRSGPGAREGERRGQSLGMKRG